MDEWEEPSQVQRLRMQTSPRVNMESWALLSGLQSPGGEGLAGGRGGIGSPAREGWSQGPASHLCPILLGAFWRPEVIQFGDLRSQNGSCCHALLSRQAQLIHDRNTASHSVVATRTQAPSTPDKVQMTWTKEKLIAEKYKNKEPGVSGFKDLFSLKP